MRQHRIYALFFAALFIVLSLKSTAQSTFYNTYGHTAEGGEGRNVAQAADGGYFLSYYFYSGSKFIACLTKLNCAGVKEWDRKFDCGSTTFPVDVIPRADNGCIFVLSIRKTTDWETAVLNLDALGNQQWTTTIPLHIAGVVGCSARANDGSIYVCGSITASATGTTGTALAKLKPSGDLDWMKQYYDQSYHTPLSLTITSGNKIAITGTTSVSGPFFSDLFVMLCDQDGTFLQRKVFGTYYDDNPQSICSDNVGNIYITGYSYFLGSAWDMMFLKLDGNLGVQQSVFYDAGTAQGEQARAMLCAADGTIAIFGDEGGFNERNPAMLSLNSDGTVNWARSYPVSPIFTNYCFQGTYCSDKGFLLTGDFRPPTQERCAPILKTTTDGDAGCFTIPLNLVSRTEPLSVLDTSVWSSTTADTVSREAIPDVAAPTNETVYCSKILPCGNFIKTGELCPQVCYQFTDHSLNATSWQWDFENGVPAVSTEQNPPQVCFAAEGIQKITLKLSNANGSTFYTQYIDATLDCILSVPTIFSPNGDGINDVFFAKGIHGNFSLYIYNRWGNLIYSAGSPGKWWDGTTNSGAAAADGVYFYILQVQEGEKTLKGTVQLVR
jgi:gliding motility-associated-like protein